MALCRFRVEDCFVEFSNVEVEKENEECDDDDDHDDDDGAGLTCSISDVACCQSI